MEINFYGVLQEDIQKVMAVLLEKAYKANKNSILLTKSVEEANSLDAKLWSSVSWLPHCFALEKRAVDANVVIYVNDESQSLQIRNNANFLFIFDSAKHYDLDKFEKVYIVFNLNNQNSLKNNRDRWKELQKKGYLMHFYKQNELGKFEETKL